LINANPGKAGTELESDAQRARLLALAHSRTISFRDRTPVQQLVASGYILLRPHVRIVSSELSDYIRHDLPESSKNQIRRMYNDEDDNWEHIRLSVFVALSTGCVLIAYTSPNTVQLIGSAFLALTALLPLSRDPISSFLASRQD
jgi:hypothetical protein